MKTTKIYILVKNDIVDSKSTQQILSSFTEKKLAEKYLQEEVEKVRKDWKGPGILSDANSESYFSMWRPMQCDKFCTTLFISVSALIEDENYAQNNDTEDICKSCEHYWQDFPMPLEAYISHCEIVDKKPELKEMNDVVPYPCLKCPFDSYKEKIKKS